MRLHLQFSASIIVIATLTACSGVGTSNSFTSSSSAQGVTPTTPTAPVQTVNVAKIRQSVISAQSSIQTAEAALGTIFNPDGSFNWDVVLGGVDFSKMGANTQTCLANAFPTSNLALLILTVPQDIANALKCVLDDVAATAGIAGTDLKSALTTLNSALLQIAPGSADALEIQSMIDQVQSLQTAYSGAMQLLASQMTVAVTFLNQLPTLATAAIPIPVVSLIVGMSASAFLQPIVFEIMHFQSQLQAL